MEISGTLIKILPLQTGQSKNGEWKKQDFIIQIEGNYPKSICFTLWGNQIEQNNLVENSFVKVSFDLESREFNGRWYTEAKAWRVVKTDNKVPAPQDNISVESIPDANIDDSTDDLPF